MSDTSSPVQPDSIGETTARLCQKATEYGAGSPDPKERLRAIQFFAEANCSHWTLAELLRELPRRICELMRRDFATILLLTEDRGHVVALGSCGLEEEVERHVLVPVGSGIAGRIAQSGVPIILDELLDILPVSPVLRERVWSLIGVPLLAGGRVIGVIQVGTFVPCRFTEGDLGLLLVVADLAASAIDRASARDGARIRQLA